MAFASYCTSMLLLVVFLAYSSVPCRARLPRCRIRRHWLYVHKGVLVEQLEGDPFDRAIADLAGDGRPQSAGSAISCKRLEFARDDDRIEVVYLELSSLLGAGLSKLQIRRSSHRGLQVIRKTRHCDAPTF